MNLVPPIADARTHRPSPVAERIAAARHAQATWASQSVATRLKCIRALRHAIAAQSDELVAAIEAPFRTHAVESLAAEIIPLADACRFLERTATKTLAAKRLSRMGRPLWMWTVDVEQHRDPWGVVLIVGPSNYPLFLPGVQMISALTAGNAVLLKPAPGASRVTELMVRLAIQSGIDPALVGCMPESQESVRLAVEAGVDKVVLTGSATTGRRVQSLLADSLTPAAMELSGCDAVFMLESADLELVLKCLMFGMTFNRSATCIAPRRVFVPRGMQAELEGLLIESCAAEVANPNGAGDVDWNPEMRRHRDQLVADAVAAGARAIVSGAVTILADAVSSMEITQTDLFLPTLLLIPVESMVQAKAADRDCPYALGATIFGDATTARRLAAEIDAGCVTINDMIAPTADPRVAFGGRRESGFGVTRGTAGLLEMTQPKTIIHRRGRWLPHLERPTMATATLLSNFLKWNHGSGFRPRWAAWRRMIAAAMQQGNEKDV